ncbi:MAG: hypothetical protein PWP23_3194 [Candidatus Sumerlaeota bacterium]|nr:hypothetical protein [Candidatus Sumerlaeota bacterium]
MSTTFMDILGATPRHSADPSEVKSHYSADEMALWVSLYVDLVLSKEFEEFGTGLQDQIARQLGFRGQSAASSKWKNRSVK